MVAPHENVRQHFGQFLSPPHRDPRRSLCQSLSVSRRDSRQTVGQGGISNVREEVKCKLHVTPLDGGRGGGATVGVGVYCSEVVEGASLVGEWRRVRGSLREDQKEGGEEMVGVETEREGEGMWGKI